jgi:hypothetical protein
MDAYDKRRLRRQRFAERFWMHIDPVDEPAVDVLISRRRSTLPLLLALILPLLVVAGLAGFPWNDVIAVLFASAVLVLWAMSVRATEPWPGVVELSSGTTTGCLVSPLKRGALAIAALMGVAVALWVALDQRHVVGRGLITLALVPLFAFIATEVSAGLIARAPLPGGRDGLRYAALAWRSHVVHRQYDWVEIVSVVALAVVVLRRDTDSTIPALALLIAAAGFALTSRHRSGLHFRTRHWPHLGDDLVHTAAATLVA